MNRSWNLRSLVWGGGKKCWNVKLTYLSPSMVSLAPNPDTRHFPLTVKSPHPCFHPTARTWPSELHSKAVTSFVCAFVELDASIFWDLGMIPSSKGKLMNWISPLENGQRYVGMKQFEFTLVSQSQSVRICYWWLPWSHVLGSQTPLYGLAQPH